MIQMAEGVEMKNNHEDRHLNEVVEKTARGGLQFEGTMRDVVTEIEEIEIGKGTQERLGEIVTMVDMAPQIIMDEEVADEV